MTFDLVVTVAFELWNKWMLHWTLVLSMAPCLFLFIFEARIINSRSLLFGLKECKWVQTVSNTHILIKPRKLFTLKCSSGPKHACTYKNYTKTYNMWYIWEWNFYSDFHSDYWQYRHQNVCFLGSIRQILNYYNIKERL